MKKEKKKIEVGSFDKYVHLLVPFLILVGAGFVFLLLILPRFNEIKLLRTEIGKNEALAGEVSKKVRLIQSIDEETLKRQSSMAVLALPNRKNVYNLVVVMSNVASEFGFKVETFKIGLGEIDSGTVETEEEVDEGEEEEISMVVEDNRVMGVRSEPVVEDKLEKIPITVELIGPVEKYLDLLLAMEEAIPLLSIDKLDVRNKRNETEMEMTVAVHFSPNQGGLDLDKISLEDLMMTEEELLAAERLESFENYVEDGGVMKMNKPDVVRKDPFRL